jgi:hypothetical protein
MSGSTAISYQNNVLQTKLTYKGEGVDLVEAGSGFLLMRWTGRLYRQPSKSVILSFVGCK